jgi:hypothetical protein
MKQPQGIQELPMIAKAGWCLKSLFFRRNAAAAFAVA